MENNVPAMSRVIFLSTAFPIDAPGLSSSAESAVSALRDRVHSALYQHCADVCEPTKAAGRLAKILLLLPQLYMLSTEVVEHQKMRHTFALPYELNPLLVQLFGDIFEEGKTEDSYLIPTLHTTPATPVAIVPLQHPMERSHSCSRLNIFM
ncbi:hypothetical protein NECAME_04022 [Necator americanus]|uniref:NR LBD domain-containing protein n=1 Tax=Necator americanus TaxID=51031 RepID=W2SZU6_NECAM|nr:hypothetical protein NECAME_04022 [Necator americanus]ETN74536.1 hypothetical protein NECAME_04022 [Necator americanus]